MKNKTKGIIIALSGMLIPASALLTVYVNKTYDLTESQSNIVAGGFYFGLIVIGLGVGYIVSNDKVMEGEKC